MSSMKLETFISKINELNTFYHISTKPINPKASAAAKQKQEKAKAAKGKMAQEICESLLSQAESNEAKAYIQQVIVNIQNRYKIIEGQPSTMVHPESETHGKYYDQSRYEFLLPICQLAYLSENNGLPEEHALKLSILFDNTQDALIFVKNNVKTNKLPIHDACLFQLPDMNECDFSAWKKIVKTNIHDHDVLKLLPKAGDLEKVIKQNTLKEKGEKLNREALKLQKMDLAKAIKEFKALRQKRIKLNNNLNSNEEQKYKSLIAEIPELRIRLFELSAGIKLNEVDMPVLLACDEYYKQQTSGAYKYMLEHGLTKKDFAKFSGLERVDDDKKIPNIKLDGAVYGYPGTYLMRVSVEDEMQAARAACFGKLTNCCQSLSGQAGESCIIHGLTNPNGGFYVLCKGDLNNPSIEDDVLGQCWAWRSNTNAIVFDSVEASNKVNSTKASIAMFEALAENLCEQGFTKRVCCGTGSGISKRIGVDIPYLTPEQMLREAQATYTDAAKQRLISDTEHPFYLFGLNDKQKKRTIDGISLNMRNPNALCKNDFICKAIDHAILMDNESLLAGIRESAVANSRQNEVDNLIKNMKTYIRSDISTAELNLLLNTNNFYINVKNKDGVTPLIHAAKNNEVSLQSTLLEQGADFEMSDRTGKNAFIYAIQSCNEEAIQMYLSRGIDLNIGAPLIYAIETDNRNIIRLLVEHGADIHAKNSNGETPLIKAAQLNKIEAAKVLLALGANSEINFMDNFSCSALIHSAARNHPEMNRLLIENGADINLIMRNGSTALFEAIKYVPEEAACNLIKSVDNLNFKHKDSSGQTALTIAVKKGYLKFVEAAVEKGADVNTKDNSLKTSLMHALEKGNKGLALKLIELKSNINDVDINGKSCLMYAIENQLMNLALLMIDKGANSNAIDDEGKTSFIFAIITGNLALTTSIHKSCDINQADKNGKTPLMYALQKGNSNLAQKLIDWGATTNATDKLGRTSLMHACIGGCVDMVPNLVKDKSEINVQDHEGNCPLIFATESGQKDLVTYLIEQGANFNVTNKNNETPLKIACEFEIFDVANTLIQNGANPNTFDIHGKSLLRVACDNTNLELASTILDNFPESALRTEGNSYPYIEGYNILLNETKRSKPNKNIKFIEFLLNKSPESATSLITEGYEKGHNALSLAIYEKQSDMVKLILEHAPQAATTMLDLKYEEGHNAFTYAVYCKESEMVKIIIEHQPEAVFSTITEGYAKGHNALTMAISMNQNSTNRYKEVVDQILDSAPNLATVTLDNENDRGYNALTYALNSKNTVLAKLIIEKAPEVVNQAVKEGNPDNWSGMTPLMIALTLNLIELTDELIIHGADVNALDEANESALLCAVDTKSERIINRLIESGVNLNVQNINGTSALSYAARLGEEKIANILMAHGADTKVVSSSGKTILHCAAQGGNPNLVNKFINEGSDLRATDNEGKTPLDWAKESGHKHIVELMQNKIKDSKKLQQVRAKPVIHGMQSRNQPSQEILERLSNKSDSVLEKTIDTSKMSNKETKEPDLVDLEKDVKPWEAPRK